MGVCVGWAVDWAVGELVGGVVFGVVGGTAQWLVLREQVGRSGWWVLAAVVSGAVGAFVGWPVAGAITGLTLIVLLRDSIPEVRDPQPEELAETKGQFLGFERADWWFWIKWVLVSAVGGAVGLVVGVSVGEAVGEAMGAFAGLAVGWALVGTAQWIVLRKRVCRSGWWVLASAVGGLLSAAVGGLVGVSVGPLVGLIVGMAASWAVVGTAQWMVLRERVHGSGWWVLVTAVGGAVGGLVGGSVGVLVSVLVGMVGLAVSDDVPNVLGAVAVTVLLGSCAGVLAVGGAITGFALIMLLRHPIPKVRDPQQEESVDVHLLWDARAGEHSNPDATIDNDSTGDSDPGGCV